MSVKHIPMAITFDYTLYFIAVALFAPAAAAMRYRRWPPRRLITAWVLYAYVILVLAMTLLPIYLFDAVPPIARTASTQWTNLMPLATLTANDLRQSLLNVAMLIPLGFLLPSLLKTTRWQTAAVALGFSAGIEVVQYLLTHLGGWTWRVADVDDIIFNLLGGVLGYELFALATYLLRQARRGAA
jgi:glycopeptide antibiotics resistance protein